MSMNATTSNLFLFDIFPAWCVYAPKRETFLLVKEATDATVLKHRPKRRATFNSAIFESGPTPATQNRR